MVPSYGHDNHELHQQSEGTEQRKKERGCDRKTIGIDGVPSDAGKRQVAVPDPKA